MSFLVPNFGSAAASIQLDDLIPSMTLEQYERMAIEQGVQGSINDWTLESAGYARNAALRQTDSPAFTVDHTHNRSESVVNDNGSIADSKVTRLTMRETTPLGTQITATGDYGDANNSSNGGYGKPGFVADVTQPLYVFVKNATGRSRRRTELTFSNAKNSFEASTLSIRSQARSLYYQVILGDESIEVQERAVKSAQKVLDVTTALVRAGRSAPVETTRVKIRLEAAQRQLQNATVGREKSILNAKNFVYLPLDSTVEFSSKLQFKPVKLSLDRLTQYGLLHNPNLQITRRAKESAQLTYDAAVEPTRPGLSLRGNYRTQDNPYFDSHSWSWTGNATWTFFDSFVTQNQAKSAKIGKWVADLNSDFAERRLRVDIKSRYLDLKRIEKQIQDFATSRQQSQHDVEVVRLRFRNGLDRLIDVFNAEDQMLALDNEYLGLLVSYNTTKDSLAELVGTELERIR